MTDWESALSAAGEQLATAAANDSGGQRIGALVGGHCDVESLVALKDLLNSLDSDTLCTEESFPTETSCDLRANYLFNTQIARIDEADVLVLVGANPRYEAAILNSRIRKAWLHNDLQVGLLGDRVDLTYSYDYLGGDTSALRQLLDGRHEFSETLKQVGYFLSAFEFLFPDSV